MPTLPFKNRYEAGYALAEGLREYTRAPDALVAGLLRGGAAIGRVIADELELPLIPYAVRKIGHPYHREFGVGAIAEGGATYFDELAIASSGLTKADLNPIIEEERAELRRRKEKFSRFDLPVRDMRVILADDGAATGVTMLAAIADIRAADAREIIVALPVCPPDTEKKLLEAADTVVILSLPSPFGAVGQWYLEFPQLSDEQVIALLDKNPDGKNNQMLQGERKQ